mmetsp:Transcript_11024/g.35441  ORF Transcript_11024/g.35441 Transcript_11024/m.35441 type:complete len:202 (+) Transcript_11024:622-1227(+)
MSRDGLTEIGHQAPDVEDDDAVSSGQNGCLVGRQVGGPDRGVLARRDVRLDVGEYRGGGGICMAHVGGNRAGGGVAGQVGARSLDAALAMDVVERVRSRCTRQQPPRQVASLVVVGAGHVLVLSQERVLQSARLACRRIRRIAHELEAVLGQTRRLARRAPVADAHWHLLCAGSKACHPVQRARELVVAVLSVERPRRDPR